MAEPGLRRRAATAGLVLPRRAGWLTVSELEVGARFVLRGPETLVASLSHAAGVDLGQAINRAASNDRRAALRLGPDEWLLLAPAADAVELPRRLAAAAGRCAYALVDVGHRSAALRLAGPAAADVLASGCPQALDGTRFPLDRCTRTVFAKAEIVLWRCGEHEFQLEAWRSFVPYIVALLERELAAS